MADDARSTGTILEIKGVVIDARFPDGLPCDLQRDRDLARRGRAAAGRRGAAAPGRRPGARGRLRHHRRPGARHRGRRHRRRRSRCRWASARSAASSTCSATSSTRAPPIGRGRAVADPPARAGVRPAQPHRGDLRDRHQGRGPARPVREGRQDRPVRRRRRGQDRAHPGADPQHRPGARRPVGVRRRRRAHPRGQRPLGRDEGERGHRQDRARVRPDERAPRRPSARRPVGPDDGRVLPRQGRPGRPAVRGQHLPLRAGRLRGVGPPRPHAVRRGLPADPPERDGRPAGADHLDPQRLGHLGAGHLRPRRRPHRPGPGGAASPTSTPPRCSSRAISEKGIYPAVDPLDSTSRLLSVDGVGAEHYEVATRVQEILQTYKDLQDIIAILGVDELTDEQKLVGVARPPHRALPLPALPRGRGLHRPARASTCRWPRRSAASRRSSRASTTTCPRRRSSWSAASTRPSRRPPACRRRCEHRRRNRAPDAWASACSRPRVPCSTAWPTWSSSRASRARSASWPATRRSSRSCAWATCASTSPTAPWWSSPPPRATRPSRRTTSWCWWSRPSSLEEIDRARAQAALERAEQRLGDASLDEAELITAEKAKARAENRIRVADRAAG